MIDQALGIIVKVFSRFEDDDVPTNRKSGHALLQSRRSVTPCLPKKTVCILCIYRINYGIVKYPHFVHPFLELQREKENKSSKLRHKA